MIADFARYLVMFFRELAGDCPWCGARMQDWSWKRSFCPNGCDE